jgi:3-dehydro-4-phosphotetronate decarboxylase
MNESSLRERMVMLGASLHARGYTCGSSGNISVKLDDGILVTPTGTSLGWLEPAQIAKVNWDGAPSDRSGNPPSKETFLHLAMYRERASAGAVVHLHSTSSVCVSCMADVDPTDCLPPMTAYYVMKVRKLPLIPYYPPGDLTLASAVRSQARQHHAMLLANHGPVVAGPSLDAAVDIIEELEENAKIFLLLRGTSTRCLTAEQVAALRERFPS